MEGEREHNYVLGGLTTGELEVGVWGDREKRDEKLLRGEIHTIKNLILFVPVLTSKGGRTL